MTLPRLAPWMLALAAILTIAQPCSAGPANGLAFCCSESNDLYRALGSRHRRYETAEQAISRAQPGSAVLLLADGYPQQRVNLAPALFDAARQKELRLFIEFPGALPGLDLAAPRGTTWERLVVASDAFAGLPKLRILAAHDCRFVPITNAPAADLVVARVAGYDKAVYGLPPKEVYPVLFEIPDRKIIVATTRLSGFVTGRFAPASDWKIVWEGILARLVPDRRLELRFTPAVDTAFGPTEKLPRTYQRKVFNTAAEWFLKSELLVHSSEKPGMDAALLRGEEVTEPRAEGLPTGDGTCGILEGYASGIRYDGRQLRRLPLRADCNLESAMVLALNGQANQHARSRVIASNLIDFVYYRSGMCQGGRSDPNHGAYGLIGWGDVAPAWMVANYGDDNARAMLATAIAGVALGSRAWDEPLMRALLANLRTTGKLGFRGDRIDMPALQQNGWKPYYDGSPVSYSPHFESYLWAAYLWAYQRTGYPPFLERSRTAISMTMKAYPQGWRWQDNLERAHMLLCLAWLVRVEDTAEHREWLKRVATDLIAHQESSGAIRERLGPAHGGHYQTPQRNEDYGTGETPLLQENGDPVTDQLYTTGFALLGLHEAVGATGDSTLKNAEEKLAEFLCRIQNRSEKMPWLHGTWFRAFDYKRWEAWASSADVGWGAWSLESGWAQAWTAAILGLRERGTTVWEFTGASRVADHFEKNRRQMGLPE